ncbi:hypothetical protein [Variovorax sp. J22R115]|uniref:hypothetical protein n=1 Tax=Variovorax sp. J22R115 TaxID=3053509 RepID=UPI002576761A|nr:hypothetical protein [Variovorax sp. J22R115]MDM0048618.1 hypothetical protein [Variovorax sp. J22R115]
MTYNASYISFQVAPGVQLFESFSGFPGCPGHCGIGGAQKGVRNGAATLGTVEQILRALRCFEHGEILAGALLKPAAA